MISVNLPINEIGYMSAIPTPACTVVLNNKKSNNVAGFLVLLSLKK
jgi:hypothetical protein